MSENSEQNLRVMHISTETGRRGGEQQVKLLTDGLALRGHECHVLSPAGSALHADRSASPLMKMHSLTHFGEFDVLAARRLAQIVRDHRIDVVHAHTSHAHSLAWIAARWMRDVPVVISRRVDFAVSKGAFSKLKYVSPVLHYIAISEAVKGVLIAGGVMPANIDVVHSGVPLSRYLYRPGPRDETEAAKWQISPGTSLIANVAALTDHKDQATLLRAAAHLRESHPAFRIVIAGSGEMEEELRALASELKLQDHVHFAGYVNDLASLYRAADLFVMSSHLEGLCTSILDAMMAGVPVVAMRTGGIPEIVRHEENGLLADPRDFIGLAAALKRMLSDGALKSKCIEAGRNSVQDEFTDAAMVEGTVRVYRKLLAERNPVKDQY